MNKKAQLRDIEDIFKAIVTGIIGIIFLTVLAPIVSPVILSSFVNLGIFLIILGVIIAVISILKKRFNGVPIY